MAKNNIYTIPCGIIHLENNNMAKTSHNSMYGTWNIDGLE